MIDDIEEDDLPDDEAPDDDEDCLCANCNGSGEGMHDGSICSTCGGSGVVSDGGDEDYDDGYREDDE